tara:strand:- start:261 stop:899 length:639 start_codon:yes stop_codon:yes gene_type:complete
MNINKFYKDGYDEWQMPPHLSAMIWGQLLCENWIDHPVYKEIPDWSINKGGEAQNQDQKYLRGKEQEINEQSLSVVPPTYQTVIEELLKEDYYSEWFETVCGYQQKIKFIDVWNGSDDLKWHWDGVEDHDMGFLIYFTEEHQWNEEWKSYLQIGEREWPNNDEIDIKHTAYPSNGKIILLNNMNPRFVHSVAKLTNINVNRYTINAGISLWN